MKNILVLALVLLALCAVGYSQEQQDDHDHEEGEQHEGEVYILNQSEIWGFGFLAGFAISLIGFLAAILLLLAKKCCSLETFQIIVKFLFSLACGALLGDSIIHILAEAYRNQELDPLTISGILICSILLFIIFEKVMQSFGVAHHHWLGEQEHQHNHGQSQENSGKLRQSISVKKIGNPENFNESQQKISIKGTSSKIVPEDNLEEESIGEENKKCTDCCKQYAGKGTAGYMNLIGSLIHNFIDGLAVGIVFATGNSLEIVPVLVAVIAHEIPRELGDVAILLKSNFNEIQTVVCNGVINLISLVGVIIGLAVVNFDDVAKSYTMVFVAGNFLFIGADIWRNMFKNKGQNSKCKNVLEFVGFGVGVGAMFALTLLESGEEHNH